MGTKYFHAVSKGAIGDGAAGDVQKWIEQYVNVLFPENGIEYWSDNQYTETKALKAFSVFPVAGFAPENVHHVACYVRQGNCEGLIIEISLLLKNGSFTNLCWAKTFGGEEESWSITRAVSQALESIIFFQEVPLIVALYDMLPRKQNSDRFTVLTGPVIVGSDEVSLLVKTVGGQVIHRIDHEGGSEGSKEYIDAYRADWLSILSNMKIPLASQENG